MTEREPDRDIQSGPAGVNPGYAVLQIARALIASEEHEDPQTRERARQRISRWQTVLRNILSGGVEYGSRTPVEGIPAWATLEVITGGFATGELVAGGPLQEHECKLLTNLPAIEEGQERRGLNGYFLTDAGLAQLQDRLRTGCYDVTVPEEGALLVVAWLVENGCAEDARDLIERLAPYFSRLRFYPLPLEKPRRFGSRVHVQDVDQTLANLARVKPNQRLLAQKEAVEVWAPLYDRVVALFLETVEDGWPCQTYPDGWADRALALLGEYAALKKEHLPGGKLERANGHQAQLIAFLGQCAMDPRGLTGREVGRIRLILQRYVEKRGAPDSPACVAARRRQAADVSAPAHHQIAQVVRTRLEKYPRKEGLDHVGPLQETVSTEEAAQTGIPAGTPIPPSIQRKVERCLNETVEILVERGLITSGDMLAEVLPQMTSGLRAAGIADPALGQLYAAIYRAFRRRRSLLLLNLQKQVQIEELPWVAAIDRFRSAELSSREVARQTLEQVLVVTLTSFPQAVLPNKLLQELRALIKGIELNIPLVEELAADIFMGRFSDKFVESAKRAADLLAGSLYATYYGIDYAQVRQIPQVKEPPRRKKFWQRPQIELDPLARLCTLRAGVSFDMWDPAIKGMIIEQQQILTTQNLAALFLGLDLARVLHGRLDEMARQCFEWICRRQQIKIAKWHARLLMLKNTAYAWRQMIFYLALLPQGAVTDFLGWADDHLVQQPEEFVDRFRPALRGLVRAANGSPPDAPDARRFLGWSKARHWLLPAPEKE